MKLLHLGGEDTGRIAQLTSFLSKTKRNSLRRAANWVASDTDHGRLKMASGLCLSSVTKFSNGESRWVPVTEFKTKIAIAENLAVALRADAAPVSLLKLFIHPRSFNRLGKNFDKFLVSDPENEDDRPWKNITAHMLALDPFATFSLDSVFFPAYRKFIGWEMANLAQAAAALSDDARPPLEVVDLADASDVLSDDTLSGMVYYVGASLEERDVLVRKQKGKPYQENSPLNEKRFLAPLNVSDGAAYEVVGATVGQLRIYANTDNSYNSYSSLWAMDKRSTGEKINLRDTLRETERLITLQFVRGEKLGLPVEHAAFMGWVKRARAQKSYVHVRSEADYHAERLRTLAAFVERVHFFGGWAREACERFKEEQGMTLL